MTVEVGDGENHHRRQGIISWYGPGWRLGLGVGPYTEIVSDFERRLLALGATQPAPR